jgi:hypothetical protein
MSQSGPGTICTPQGEMQVHYPSGRSPTLSIENYEILSAEPLPETAGVGVPHLAVGGR